MHYSSMFHQGMAILLFNDAPRLEPPINGFMPRPWVGLLPVYVLMTAGWGNDWPMPVRLTTICNVCLPGVQQFVQRTSGYAQIMPLFRGIRTVNPNDPPSLHAHANLVTQSRSVKLMWPPHPIERKWFIYQKSLPSTVSKIKLPLLFIYLLSKLI